MDDTLTLRRTTTADLAALDLLFARSYAKLLKTDYPPSTLVLALPLLARANPLLIASGTYWCAEREGAILAAGGWSWPRPQGGASSRGVAHIRHVVTDHAHIRKGIGRVLLAHVLSEARDAGARILDCQSTLTAVPFYEALGFRKIGPVVIALRPGIEFAAMQMQRAM